MNVSTLSMSSFGTVNCEPHSYLDTKNCIVDVGALGCCPLFIIFHCIDSLV